ncbi:MULTISPECIES: hypothetical protein [Microbacterium]|uniref:hypothetical protein n=1 Tax=Microbacterium TaxID=33882 RepID=UPI0027838577|nr:MULTISPECIES: hypothetical protein [Microbacterium]MDQ1084484.1 hypothetical protein [Microbacterium sp. SORGH_AS_0344]MDQ1170239.1 hypothetical protein [Microbacterium proteolyticum]
MTTSAPTPTPSASEPPRRRGAAFAVSVVTIVVGACVAVGTLAGTGVSAVASMADWRGQTATYDSSTDGTAEQLTELDIDLAGGALTVEFGDVAFAQLDADSHGRKGWTFERDGDSLRVASPSGSFADWGSGSRATLVLPRDLDGSGIRADIQVTGGALELSGGFGDVTVEVAGGTASVDGVARDIDLTLSGGSATARLTDVETAAFEVAGGELTATLDGVAPTRTDVEVTAGSADITLPDDEYDVRIDDGLGSVDNGLRTSSSAVAEVDVTATMGSVRLR